MQRTFLAFVADPGMICLPPPPLTKAPSQATWITWKDCPQLTGSKHSKNLFISSRQFLEHLIHNRLILGLSQICVLNLVLPTSTLLLLSHFSCVRLLATPWTPAYQAPPSMGFFRQGYWSGVPSPSLTSTLTFLNFIIKNYSNHLSALAFLTP